MQISQKHFDFGESGGSGEFEIADAVNCNWTLSAPDWITINSAKTGNGNATINFTVNQATEAARVGVIAGRFLKNGEGIDGYFWLVATSLPAALRTLNFPKEGGTETIEVFAPDWLHWSVWSYYEGWEHVTQISGGIGQKPGNAAFTLQIDAHNEKGKRRARLQLVGLPLFIVQEGLPE